MGHCIFVFGPAGTGKSTFVQNMFEFGQSTGRNFTRVNLDPAQTTTYEFDITNYITVDEIMQELDYGPNGGLVYALKEFADNMAEIEELDDIMHGEEYLIVDFPGQIELFTHSDEMITIVEYFKKYHKCCIVYLIEAQYIIDTFKYVSACLNALICMMRFDVPHLNALTKLDLIDNDIVHANLDNNDCFIYPADTLVDTIRGSKNIKSFGKTICQMLEDNNMIRFSTINWEKEETVNDFLYSIDDCISYHDDREVKEAFK